MAKLSHQKARKEYVCEKCKKEINKGENYYKILEQFRPVRIRCANCRPERSELTNSEYYSWLYDLQDHLEERYDLRTEEGKNDLYTELEQQRDVLQEKLDNIPEQLQYASAGETLQERIDGIDSAMSEMDCLDYPEEDDENLKDLLDEYESNLTDLIQELY